MCFLSTGGPFGPKQLSVDRPTITVLGSQICHFCKCQKAWDYKTKMLGKKFGSCCPGLSLHLAEEFDPFILVHNTSYYYYDCPELLAVTSWASLRRIRMWCSSFRPASLALASFKDETRPSVSKPAANRGAEYMGIPIDTSQSDTELTWTGDTGFRHMSVKPPEGICGDKENTKTKCQC